MFGKAVDWGWRGGNPAKGIKRYPETERTRWLSEEELTKLWPVFDKYRDNPSAQALKLALLTGARPAEVVGAKWSDLDGLDNGEPIWTVPSGRSKTARAITRHRTIQEPAQKGALSLSRQGAGQASR